MYEIKKNTSYNTLIHFLHSSISPSIEDELKQWKPFNELMLVAEPEEEILFVYEHQHPNSASAGGKNGNGNGEENLPLVQLKTMPDTIKVLMHSYAQLRGKQYNDRLVLSPHYTRQIVSMVKLITCFHDS